MILVDVNLLVYAYVSESPRYPAARRWLEETLSEAPRVALPWPSLLGFVRLVSNPRVCERPVPVVTAWEQVERWLGLERIWVPQPTERHAEVLGRLLRGATSAGANLLPDAHLAALAIEHGLELVSADTDFARFPGLRWSNPLRTA